MYYGLNTLMRLCLFLSTQATKIFSACLIIGVCSLAVADDTADTINKVKTGIEAGEKILGLLQFNSTTKILSRIADLSSSIAPFLGALGPIMSLITMFLPEAESPELKEMKRRFAIVDANFDKVFNRFSEIQNLIKETSLKNQFSKYEANIIALSGHLKNLLNAPSSAVGEYNRTFCESKRSSYGNAALAIWRGMTGKSKVFQYDILIEAMKYTNNHRRKVQEIMNGGLNLILQGVKIELTYLELTGRKHSYESEKEEWEYKIKSVLIRMEEIDREIMSKWKEQAKIDAESQMAEFKDKSNADLANKVYSLLTEKFEWKLWFVVVYDPLHGGDKHWVWFCGGFHKFRHHGKNMVVTSTETDAFPLVKPCAEAELPKTNTGPDDDYAKVDAHDVVEHYFPPEYKDCLAPGHGAILKSGHPEFRGPSERFVAKDNHQYKLYVFQ